MTANPAMQLLVVDDDHNHREMLRALLEEWGYAPTGASSGEEALELCRERPFDLILMDVRMGGMSGIEATRAVKAYNPAIPILIMTAYSDVSSAVEALKGGAYDYLTKPLAFDALKLALERALDHASLRHEVRTLRHELAAGLDARNVIGQSQAMRQVLDLVSAIAPSEATVLVTGESGTGKEVVAKLIHANSNRRSGPYVAVNCAALTETLLESELFGHEKGAFTGAEKRREGRFLAADKGTIFLDEIGEIPLSMQVKLLRVIQERELQRVGGDQTVRVDVRILAATNKDLAALVEKGAFRDDLYYRLNVVQVPLPPLRERREDIPLLVAHFVEKVCTDNSMPPKTFSTEALNYLTGYEWPGNIRQLENVVESCLVLVPGNVIDVDNLPAEIRDEESQFKSAVDLLPVQLDLADTLEKIEAALIRRALVRAELVQVKAAEYLGISKSLLQYKLKKYGITGH